MIQRSKMMMASTLIAGLVGSASVAQAGRGDRISQLVSPTITSVTSDPSSGMRVIVGDDGAPFLALERLENGRITQQTFLNDVTFADAAVVKLDAAVDRIKVSRFNNGLIEFTIDLDKRGFRATRCTAAIETRRGGKAALRATCEGNGGTGTVAPLPPPVGGCTTKRSNPLGGSDWVRGLALDVDQRVLGAKISKYRILWSGNQWTAWFEPGKNDIDGTRNADGSQRRVWAYFTDHTFEYEVCPYPVNPVNPVNPVPNPNPTPYPPVPPPVVYQPTVQDIQNATAACSAAFTFKSEIDPCVTQTINMLSTQFGASAFKTVAACTRAFTFGSERKTCLSVAATSTREPVELIDFCAKSTFDSEKLACLKKWSK